MALDASVLINFLAVERTDVFRRLPGLDFAVPEAAEAEVRDAQQRAVLGRSLAAGDCRIVKDESLAEIAAATRLRRALGAGESACLALSESRGWLVACDEQGRFRRTAVERLGEARIVTTPGVLLRAIRAGVITVEEADRVKAMLEQRRFRMRFGSFRERLP